MTDLCLTQFWFKSIVFVIFLVGKISALTLCSTAVWAVNATTVAGSRGGSSGSTSKKLSLPTGVFVDNTSAIYVADSANYRVQRFPAGSTTGITVVNGSHGNKLNQFSSMDSMTVDTNGNIYILDGLLARVTKWAPSATSGILVAGGYNYSRYYDYQYGYNPNDYYSDNSSDYYNNYYYDYVNEDSEPSGMFIELQSMIIWIADTYNSQILKWPNPSTRIVVCGSYGSGSNQFNTPRGLFVDTNAGSMLYVADTNNHRIQMWTPGAMSGTTVAGMTPYFGDRLDQLYQPQTLVVDTNQNMFIVDGGNNRIVKWMIGASSGVIIAGNNMQGTAAYQLYTPYSITFDSSGSLFVADAENNRIQKFAISCPATNVSTATTPSTITTAAPGSTSNCSATVWAINATTIAGSPIGISGSTSTGLHKPHDVWVTNDDSIYILDYSNFRVQFYHPGATSGTTVINSTSGAGINQFGAMSAISLDASGNIYVLDGYYSRVTKWIPGASSGILVAGGNGSGANISQLSYPSGMFVEPNTSIIWIADSGNDRVVKWLSPSTVVLVAGTGWGVKSNQFSDPLGLFVDITASYTLYVADTGNSRIQKWLPGATNGTTVAGQSSGVYGSGLNQLYSPIALILDKNGTMYIVDSGNSRIMQWIPGSSSGVIIAGSNTYGNLPSQLKGPISIKFDSSGAFIIADQDNNRVQKFAVVCSPNSASSRTSTTTTTTTTTSLTSTTPIVVASSSTTSTIPSTSSLTTSAIGATATLPISITGSGTLVTTSTTVMPATTTTATVPATASTSTTTTTTSTSTTTSTKPSTTITTATSTSTTTSTSTATSTSTITSTSTTTTTTITSTSTTTTTTITSTSTTTTTTITSTSTTTTTTITSTSTTTTTTITTKTTTTTSSSTIISSTARAGYSLAPPSSYPKLYTLLFCAIIIYMNN